MKTIGIFDAKTRLSEICENIHNTKKGVILTKRGKPIVKIEPISIKSSTENVWDVRKRLEKKWGAFTEDFEIPPRDQNPTRPNPLD